MPEKTQVTQHDTDISDVATSEQNLTAATGMDMLANYSGDRFTQLMKAATFLAESDLLPDHFKGKPANVFIAMEIAGRMGITAIAVMQESFVIHGKLSSSTRMLHALVRISGVFNGPVRYEYGKGGDMPSSKVNDGAWCRASATLTKTGDVVDGPVVSIGMAKREGWYDKKGSKWPTMPGVMLRWRAASFLFSHTCPEVVMGVVTHEENLDSAPIDITDHSERIDDGSVRGDGMTRRRFKTIDQGAAPKIQPAPTPIDEPPRNDSTLPEETYDGPKYNDIMGGIEVVKNTAEADEIQDLLKDFPEGKQKNTLVYALEASRKQLP